MLAHGKRYPNEHGIPALNNYFVVLWNQFATIQDVDVGTDQNVVHTETVILTRDFVTMSSTGVHEIRCWKIAQNKVASIVIRQLSCINLANDFTEFSKKLRAFDLGLQSLDLFKWRSKKFLSKTMKFY